ncbi:thiopurine S-methyltransferase [Pseudomonas fulva]|nr:thiopurine S-methyltransferase [Pseudomonas fulva]MBF8781688.1 thiopurine S-methyltransferase [Pseudomonas fulva]
MEAAFWHQRWAENRIGFHQRQVNPYLQRHWPDLQLPEGSQVLVPLCGKSLDLAWLAERGHEVLGVELSRQAVQAFFTEQGLQPTIERHGEFEVWRSGTVQLWCGDFFALRAEDLVACAGLYDRAALIAFPAPMRQLYMAHLARLLPPACQGLLVTLDYPQSLVEGPPFAVSNDEVLRGLAAWQRVERLEEGDIIEQSPRFLQAGVTRLRERVYRLQR